MKTNGSSKFDLIVIEKSRVGKGMSICYVAPVPGVDFAEAVYDFGNGKGAVLKVIMIRGKEDEQDRDSNLQLQ